MDRIAQELGLRAADLILLGVLLAQWLNSRSRRDQGRRLGDVEQKVAKGDVAKELVAEIVKALTARGASRGDG